MATFNSNPGAGFTRGDGFGARLTFGRIWMVMDVAVTVTMQMN